MTAGGCALGEEALAAQRTETEQGQADTASRVTLARYFAENVAVESAGLAGAVTDGSQTVLAATAALAIDDTQHL